MDKGDLGPVFAEDCCDEEYWDYHEVRQSRQHILRYRILLNELNCKTGREVDQPMKLEQKRNTLPT